MKRGKGIETDIIRHGVAISHRVIREDSEKMACQ